MEPLFSYLTILHIVPFNEKSKIFRINNRDLTQKITYQKHIKKEGFKTTDKTDFQRLNLIPNNYLLIFIW